MKKSTEHSPRVAFINGQLMPESQAMISIRDKGVVYGDGVFDTARTFNGKLFRLQQHIDRLYESLDYARIDPGMSKGQMTEATHLVMEQNLPVLREHEDYWVTQRVTTGQQYFDGEIDGDGAPTVIIDCIPLPLRARAGFFKNGIPVAVSERPKISAAALSPNAKTNNYLNMMLAQREVSEHYPGAWALMPDPHGNLAEGAGCNFFTVIDGVLQTPEKEFVLAGISRDVVFELCADLDIPIQEKTITIEQALTASEGFFTSTSLCVCPLGSINGRAYPAAVPGPITAKIMQAFSELVDFDFAGQYLRFLDSDSTSTGL
jgi:branched-chain amino acid aminotransferase